MPNCGPQRSFFVALLTAICLHANTTAQELVLGQVLTISGPDGELGREIDAGSQACVNWINAQGGRRIKLLTRDDAGSPERAVAQAQSLVERDRAVALLGPIGPEITVSVLSWATRVQVLVVGPHAGDVVSRSKDWTTAYFLTANHSVEAAKLAAHIASLGVQRVALLYSENDVGRRALEAFEESLAIAGIVPSAMVAVAPNPKGPSAAVAAVLDSKPQAIVLGTSGTMTVQVMRALNAAWDQGGRGMYGIYGLSFAATPRELRELGSKARGLAISQVLPPVTDIKYRLVSIYHAATMSDATTRSPAGLEGCLGPLVFAEVLKRKGADLSRAGVLNEFRAARSVRIGEMEVPLGDRERPGLRFSDIVTIGTDGRIVR
jgi:ABC-type branched-subunit amino acid transport system substrate-binding protein